MINHNIEIDNADFKAVNLALYQITEDIRKIYEELMLMDERRQKLNENFENLKIVQKNLSILFFKMQGMHVTIPCRSEPEYDET